MVSCLLTPLSIFPGTYLAETLLVTLHRSMGLTWEHSVDCRFHRLPFVANISRKQLFEHLQDCASVMIAFHYAHTDAAHSMLHFDLIVEQDQHLVDHVQNESQHQLDHAQSSTSEIQLEGSAPQPPGHDLPANGVVPLNGNSHADGSQAEAGSSGKAAGVSFKGDTHKGQAVGAADVDMFAQTGHTSRYN